LSFEHLGLIEPILKALKLKGYEQPTSIQQQSIPLILKRKDILGCAQTGTGKTAAFAIPILQLLYGDHGRELAAKRSIKALVLTPTRELAIQVEQSFADYGKFTGLRHLVVFGGVSQEPQVAALRKGIDILIATPGRLLDLFNQHLVSLRDVEFLVLDEADRMLDMGFVHDVKRIIQKVPQQRQTLFFSATMPPEISKLSASILKHPAQVEASPVSSTAELVEQSMYFVDKGNKRDLLIHLLNDRERQIESVLVFTRTKHGADRVTKDLNRAGISAEAIHGNKSQTARQRALQNFKSKRTRVLVATDIAARGIDIKELAHVINYELPNIPETYVHRIGRTGRAGASGLAFSFCDHEERAFLKDIHRLLDGTIPVVQDHPFPSAGKSAVPRHPASRPSLPVSREGRTRSSTVNRPGPRKVISRNTLNPAN
jgi:ATP-dependent RNA helicase RhlE